MQKALLLALVAVPSFALAGDPPKPAAPPPVAAPKPSAEITELAGLTGGTWKCTGKATMDGVTMVDAKATITNKVDLDKWWIQTNFNGTIAKNTFKFTGFTGYNTAEQKFYRYMVDNAGGSETSTAVSIDHGMADKWALLWEGESRMAFFPPQTSGTPERQQAIDQARKSGILAGGNVMKIRGHESSSKDGLAMTGEMSRDGGKTWVPAYDVLCKH